MVPLNILTYRKKYGLQCGAVGWAQVYNAMAIGGVNGSESVPTSGPVETSWYVCIAKLTYVCYSMHCDLSNSAIFKDF